MDSMTRLFEGILQSKPHCLLQCSEVPQESHSKWLQDQSESAVSQNVSMTTKEQGVIERQNSVAANPGLVRTHLSVDKAASSSSWHFQD